MHHRTTLLAARADRRGTSIVTAAANLAAGQRCPSVYRRATAAVLVACLLPCCLAAAELYVAKDGSADYSSIQDAVDAASPGDVIWIGPGAYWERVVVETPFLTLAGSGPNWHASNIISNIPSGAVAAARDSASLLVTADHVTVANLGVKNCAYGGPGHTIAGRFEGDGFEVIGVRFVGESDTLNIEGQGLVRNSLVFGRVDFVWGQGLATFVNTQLHVRDFGTSTRGVVIAQGKRFVGEQSGFTFLDCRFTSDPGLVLYLGRLWQPRMTVAIFNSYLGPGTAPEGFRNDWDPEREQTVFLLECDNYGPGSDSSQRVSWARQCG